MSWKLDPLASYIHQQLRNRQFNKLLSRRTAAAASLWQPQDLFIFTCLLAESSARLGEDQLDEGGDQCVFSWVHSSVVVNM